MTLIKKTKSEIFVIFSSEICVCPFFAFSEEQKPCKKGPCKKGVQKRPFTVFIFRNQNSYWEASYRSVTVPSVLKTGSFKMCRAASSVVKTWIWAWEFGAKIMEPPGNFELLFQTFIPDFEIQYWVKFDCSIFTIASIFGSVIHRRKFGCFFF